MLRLVLTLFGERYILSYSSIFIHLSMVVVFTVLFLEVCKIKDTFTLFLVTKVNKRLIGSERP